MLPIGYDANDSTLPLFTTSQIDDYGLPLFWGYDRYLVVETRDDTKYVTDFKMEQEMYRRPIHRYNRRERFYHTLTYLLGDRGKVPPTVLLICNIYAEPTWEGVRKVLKEYKWRVYYNRIPFILQHMVGKQMAQVKAEQYRAIMADFDWFHAWFEQNKFLMDRKYFPNMKFIALKLMDRHGIVTTHPIPGARTKRKTKELEEIWDLFTKQ